MLRRLYIDEAERAGDRSSDISLFAAFFQEIELWKGSSRAEGENEYGDGFERGRLLCGDDRLRSFGSSVLRHQASPLVHLIISSFIHCIMAYTVHTYIHVYVHTFINSFIL
jgi:hypothetical protein